MTGLNIPMSVNLQECERCHSNTRSSIMSMFNTEMICMSCKDKEFQHPDYARAQEAEINAVKQGNYNFAGIGKPSNL